MCVYIYTNIYICLYSKFPCDKHSTPYNSVVVVGLTHNAVTHSLVFVASFPALMSFQSLTPKNH